MTRKEITLLLSETAVRGASDKPSALNVPRGLSRLSYHLLPQTFSKDQLKCCLDLNKLFAIFLENIAIKRFLIGPCENVVELF